MGAEQLVNKMNQLEAEGKPAYYVWIAKAALWIVSAVLFGIVMVGGYKLASNTIDKWQSLDTGPATVQAITSMGGNVVAAAQALAVICLSVLGYRGMKRK